MVQHLKVVMVVQEQTQEFLVQPLKPQLMELRDQRQEDILPVVEVEMLTQATQVVAQEVQVVVEMVQTLVEL
tara:strand:+ start:235 stop:450 length:216 start_codon:yes stop_codon:yes gene_type:complete